MKIRTGHVRAIGAITTALLLTVAVPAATALDVGGLDITTSARGCPAEATYPATRLGEIGTANTYLRSLVTHDTSHLEVAAHLVRTENGSVTADGAESLCKGNQGPVTTEDAVSGIRELTWPVVQGDETIAFYLLDTPSSATSYIAERFRVDHGLIQHIQAVFYIDTTGYVLGPESVATDPAGVSERLFDSSDGPMGFFAPADDQGDVFPPPPDSRAIVARATQAYLTALVRHNASSVPLASDAARTANERPDGASAAQIRAQIASSANEVDGIEDLHIYVEGSNAVAMYKIKTPAVDPIGIDGSAVWAATLVQLHGRLISQIETFCSASELCGARSSPGLTGIG